MRRNPVVHVDPLERERTTGGKLTAAYEINVTRTTHIRPHTVETGRTDGEAETHRGCVQSKHVEALYVTRKYPVARQQLGNRLQRFSHRHRTDVHIHVRRNPVVYINPLERERTVGNELTAAHQIDSTCTTHIGPKTIQPGRTSSESQSHCGTIESQDVEALNIRR